MPISIRDGSRRGLSRLWIVGLPRFFLVGSKSVLVTFQGGRIMDSALTASAVATQSLDLFYSDEAAAFFY